MLYKLGLTPIVFWEFLWMIIISTYSFKVNFVTNLVIRVISKMSTIKFLVVVTLFMLHSVTETIAATNAPTGTPTQAPGVPTRAPVILVLQPKLPVLQPELLVLQPKLPVLQPKLLVLQPKLLGFPHFLLILQDIVQHTQHHTRLTPQQTILPVQSHLINHLISHLINLFTNHHSDQHVSHRIIRTSIIIASIFLPTWPKIIINHMEISFFLVSFSTML